MKSVSAAEFEAHAREYLAAVQRGEDVVVTDAGHPIARLSGLDDSNGSSAPSAARGALAIPGSPPGMRRQRDLSSEPSDNRSRLLDALLRGPDKRR